MSYVPNIPFPFAIFAVALWNEFPFGWENRASYFNFVYQQFENELYTWPGAVFVSLDGRISQASVSFSFYCITASVMLISGTGMPASSTSPALWRWRSFILSRRTGNEI